MPRQALAVLVALLAVPSLAEPYRPLPRYPADRNRERIAGSRHAQRLHGESPIQPAAAPAAGDAVDAVQEEPEEEVHVIAIPPLAEEPRSAAHALRATPASAARRGVAAEATATPRREARPGRPAEEGPAAAPASVGLASTVAAPAAPRPAELKVSVGQARTDGGFVMLVEDPSGARIELVLDSSGRLLSVRPAGAL